MSAKIIDGNAIAASVRAEVAEGVKELVARTGAAPGLAAVRVGEDPASIIYVRNKIKACAEVGIASFEHALPERVIDLVAPEKDVDGFGPRSVAALAMGRPGLRACTPSGCLRLLDEVETQLSGARALVVGRSLIVGKPMALLLLERNATVTIAHSRTRDLAGEVGQAAVVVAAIRRAELIKGAWIKPGATVIDVGMNRLPDGKLKGDVEFAAAVERARVITPFPGGVGPMTIAYLLRNTLAATRSQLRIGQSRAD